VRQHILGVVGILGNDNYIHCFVGNLTGVSVVEDLTNLSSQ